MERPAQGITKEGEEELDDKDNWERKEKEKTMQRDKKKEKGLA